MYDMVGSGAQGLRDAMIGCFCVCQIQFNPKPSYRRVRLVEVTVYSVTSFHRDMNGRVVMVVNGEDFDIPATVENISQAARRYGAAVHGDTTTDVDVEFRDVYQAAAFWDNYGQDWVCSFRDPVTEFNEPVVVTVLKERVTTECEGHESQNGAHMGEAAYCDGSCVV